MSRSVSIQLNNVVAFRESLVDENLLIGAVATLCFSGTVFVGPRSSQETDRVAEASSDATDRSTIGRSGVPRDIGFGEHATGLGKYGEMAGRASQNANSG